MAKDKPKRAYLTLADAVPAQRYAREERTRYNNINISIPKKDYALFGVIADQQAGTGESVSQIIVQALWYTYGGKELEQIKQIIFDDYKAGKLKLPKNIQPNGLIEPPEPKTFLQVLAFELAGTPIEQIANKWNLRQRDFAMIVFQYLSNLSDQH